MFTPRLQGLYPNMGISRKIWDPRDPFLGFGLSTTWEFPGSFSWRYQGPNSLSERSCMVMY